MFGTELQCICFQYNFFKKENLYLSKFHETRNKTIIIASKPGNPGFRHIAYQVISPVKKRMQLAFMEPHTAQKMKFYIKDFFS